MSIYDKFRSEETRGTDFPRFKGKVKFILHNCKNHKDEFVFEKHNDPTNALKDIFAGNYGGLVNYDNFADLYKTWLGGVLVFAGALDTSSAGWADDYGIPARTSNACVAHAGQVPIGAAPYDQADDTTRGNPDNAGVVTTAGTTKMCWEWGTSAGNANVISSLGLTHSDVGSYGCGVASQTQTLLNPFADVACLSRQYTYGDDSVAVLAIDGNTAYTLYMVDNTTVHVYKTPINSTKFKLQGGSLLPLSNYASMITVTLSASYALQGKGDCYYHFDFANNKLLLFGVPSEGGTSLYIDEINLASWQDQTATHTAVTVTGSKLWKDRCDNGLGSNAYLTVPKKAMVYNNRLYLYGYSSSSRQPVAIYIINLANTADISSVNVDDYSQFYGGANNNTMRVNERFAMLGGIIVHDSFLINGDKTFGCANNGVHYATNNNFVHTNKIISPVFFDRTTTNPTSNMVSVNKLYLATKWNLDSPVQKTSTTSMRIEYTLTEV